MLPRRYKRTIESDTGKSSVYSDAEDDRSTMATRTDRSDFLQVGNSRIPPSPKSTSLTRSDRWSLLERETTRNTQMLQHSCVPLGMTKTSVTETEDARALERGRTVHVAEADTEWYAEQIAVSISGDAGELDVTWSFDPDEATWWCCVLDPSIPEPDAMDWSEDWSNYESSPCAENVSRSRVKRWLCYLKMCHLQNARNRPTCWQLRLIELWLRLDQRLRQRNKIAVGFFLLPACLPDARARASSKTSDLSKDSREQNTNVSSAFMLGLSRYLVSGFCQHANPAPVNSHRTWSIPVSTQSDFAVFPHENVCQPSSLKSTLRSIRARLSHLATVIAGKVDETWTKFRNSTDLDWTRAFAHDGRDPRTWPQTRPCRGRTACPGTELHCKPTRSVDQLCEMCPSPTLRSSAHFSDDVRVEEALKRMSLLRDNDFTAKAVRDMIAEIEGRKPRKKKAPPQPTIVYNTVYDSGAASSATISSGTPVPREISTPPSPLVCAFCREHPSDGTDQSTTGKMI